MLLFLSLLFIPDGAAKWHIQDLEIYTPLRVDEIAASPDFIYILDRKEAVVHQYSGHGEPIRRFGKKGQGPGELQHPNSIQRFGDKVYIEDIKGISIFSLTGEFLERKDTPTRGNTLIKVENGYIYGDWAYFGEQDYPGRLIWADDNFQNEKVIIDLRANPSQEKPENPIFDLNKPLPYNPAPESPILMRSQDGSKAYLRHVSNNITLSVVDLKTLKPVTFTVPSNRIPFNEDWANAKMKAMNEAPAQGNFKIKYAANFPDYFPTVRRMKVLGDNRVYFQHWSGLPQKVWPMTVIDESGKEAKGAFPPEAFERVVAIWKNDALVTTYDSEESAGLARVGLKQLPAFIQANPIEFENNAGFFIILD